jgi:hypothetical protein
MGQAGSHEALSTGWSAKFHPLRNRIALPLVSLVSIQRREELKMGKGILLWLLGIPIPIIILLLLFWH